MHASKYTYIFNILHYITFACILFNTRNLIENIIIYHYNHRHAHTYLYLKLKIKLFIFFNLNASSHERKT